MSAPNQSITAEHTLIRLTTEQMQDPLSVITDLCEEYTARQTRDKLREIKETALSEDGIYNSAKKRAELLFFFNLLEKALEADYLLFSAYRQIPVLSD